MESDQSRKAEQTNGNRTKREKNDEGKASNDTVRHKNAVSSIDIRPASLLEGGTAVAVAAATHASTWSRSGCSFVVSPRSGARPEASTAVSWVSGEAAAKWKSVAATAACRRGSAIGSAAAALRCDLGAAIAGSTSRGSTARARNERVGVVAVLGLGHVQGHGTISVGVLRDTGRLAVRAEGTS